MHKEKHSTHTAPSPFTGAWQSTHIFVWGFALCDAMQCRRHRRVFSLFWPRVSCSVFLFTWRHLSSSSFHSPLAALFSLLKFHFIFVVFAFVFLGKREIYTALTHTHTHSCNYVDISGFDFELWLHFCRRLIELFNARVGKVNTSLLPLIEALLIKF